MLDWETVSTGTILVVDDEEDNLEVLVETLKFNNLKTDMAGNGQQALEMIETCIPSLVLTDLSMAKMDGWALHSHIKADPKLKDIPVIALTAHAMMGDKERALIAGFDGYITKPINVATLVDDLRTIIMQINHQRNLNKEKDHETV